MSVKFGGDKAKKQMKAVESTMTESKSTRSIKRYKKRTLWKKVNSNVAIIRGTQAQSDIRFGYISRNKQAVANAIVAPIFARIKVPVYWTREDLDYILHVADEVYRTTLFVMKLKLGATFSPPCVYPIFYVHFHKIIIHMDSKVFTGEIFAENAELEKIFTRTVTEMTTNNDAIILQVNEHYFGIWFANKWFYLFCSYDGDEKGQLVGISYGTSFVLRFASVFGLKDYVLDMHTGSYSLYALKILSYRKVEKTLSKILLPRKEGSFEEEELGAEESGESVGAKSVKSVGARSEAMSMVSSVPDKEKLKEREKQKDTKKSEKIIPDEVQKLQEPSLPETVFSIDYLNYVDCGTLRANTYVKDPERILHTNVAAAFVLNLFRSSKWTKETMSDILKMGKKIFEKSSEANLIEKENWQERISFPIEYANKSFKINFDNVIYGEVVPSINSDVKCEFKQGIRDFFQRYDLGLMKGPQCVLVWQEAGNYFMFDPKERDSKGRKWTKLLSSAAGVSEKAGAACVTWHREVESLANLYISNIRQKYRQDAYKLVKFEIIEVSSKEDDFNEWRAVSYTKWILVGKKSICHFSNEEDEHRTNKTICICVVAGIFNKFQPIEEWAVDTVAEILKIGVDLYKQSIEMSAAEEYEVEEDEDILETAIADPNFSYTNIKKVSSLMGNEVELLFEECKITGRVLVSETSNERNLLRGLTEFFRNFQTGVLKIREIYISIWFENKFYYLFYPYEKVYGKNEECVCKENDTQMFRYSFALRFKDIQSLQLELLNILSLEEFDEFCITGVFSSMRKSDEKPPLFKYSDFTDEGAILLPFKENYHEGHESFGLNADKQTLANGLIALAFAHINRPEKWDKEDIMEILRIGDKIYCDVVKSLPECGLKMYTISFDEIGDVIIGSNKFNVNKVEHIGMFVHPVVEEQEEEFAQNPEEEEEVSLQDVEEEEPLPDDLRTVLTPWQSVDTVYGLIECDFYLVAIWKENNLYFIFDPKANDENGYPSERRIQVGIDQIIERNPPEILEEEGEEEEKGIESQKYKREHKKPDYNEIPNDGTAYVAWFHKFDAFLDHLLYKVPEQYHQEKFTFYTITLTNTWNAIDASSVKQNRFNFHEVMDGHMVMRATKSQNDLIFPNRFKQEATNVIAALSLALISTCTKWNSTILDIILKYGDLLYTKSYKTQLENGNSSICDKEKLSFEDIISGFTIYKIKFQFKILSKNSGGLKVPEYDELRKVLNRMGSIEGNIGGAIQIKGYMHGLWKSGNFYYVFDPNETDPSGYVVKSGGGFASLAKLNGLNGLLGFLSKKFGCLEGANTFQSYIIEITHKFPMSVPPTGITCDLIPNLEAIRNETMFIPINETTRELRGLLPRHKIPEILLCLATLIHSRLHFVELWVDNIFEQILFLGQYLLGKTKCELDKMTDTVTVDLEQMIPNFVIDNFLVRVIIRNALQGPLIADPNIKNAGLEAALIYYFRECTHAIITVGNRSFALWKECGKFYLFEDISPAFSLGSIITMESLDDIYQIIINKIESPSTSYWYEVKNCKITAIPLKDTCLPKMKPPCELHTEDGVQPQPCAKAVPSEIIEYCKRCYYWDYITNKPQMSELQKPKTNKDFRPVSEKLDVLSGKKYLREHQLYCNKCQYFLSLLGACLVAAGMRCIKRLEDWTSRTIDVIVQSGIILYKDSVATKGRTDLKITDFEKVIYICQTRIKVVPCPPRRLMFDENFCEILTHFLTNDKTLYIILQKECADIQYLALFYDDCYSYIFFPGGSGYCNNETINESKETACLLRYKHISDLASQLQKLGQNYVPVFWIGHIVSCIEA